MKLKYISLYTSTLLLAAGCAVGPDYQAPELTAPEAFSQPEGTAQISQYTVQDEQAFWNGFGDPLLAELIEKTRLNNLSLKEALARYRQGSARYRLAEDQRQPSVTAQGDVGESYLPQIERQGADQQRVNDYQLSVNASWELDLYGRLLRQARSAQAQWQASAADLRALDIAIVGELVSEYVQLRGLQQQREVTAANIKNLQQTIAIVRARLQAGRATELDLSRAQSQLANSQATLPELDNQIDEAMYTLSILTGAAPHALSDRLAKHAPLPALQQAFPTGAPGALLRRRPDVRAAERRLAAATESIGMTTAELFPRFTLSGMLGTHAADDSDLFEGPAAGRNVMLGIDWSFLDQNRVRARIAAAQANADALLADYQQTVLSALQDTENQLSRYRHGQQRLARLQVAVDAAQRSVTLAKQRYKAGLIGFYQLLETQRSLLANQQAKSEALTATSMAMVGVYRSLAGGWEDATNEQPSSPSLAAQR